MYIGRIIGNVWATKKYESTHAFKLMFVEPLNADLKKDGEPFVAVDTVGSGPGEIVLYVTASEAVIPLPVEMAPVDASIVAVVDSIYVE